ncbi:MAG: type II toxin-antitoxin system RelE/ParE family toxin [Candidatus Hydrothermarchaeales archaeon]
MPYELEFTELFVSQFEKLEEVDQKRVYNKIQELKENPYRYKALAKPFKGCFRLRV